MEGQINSKDLKMHLSPHPVACGDSLIVDHARIQEFSSGVGGGGVQVSLTKKL